MKSMEIIKFLVTSNIIIVIVLRKETLAKYSTQENLANAIKAIIIENKVLKNVSVYLTMDSMLGGAKENVHYINDVTSLILTSLEESIYCSFNLEFHHQITYKAYIHYQVILIDNVKSLSFLYNKLLRRGTSNWPYALVYIQTERNPMNPNLSAAFTLFWRLQILNIGIIVQQANGDIVMVTYYPYTRSNCANTNPVIINSFNTETLAWKTNKFFPIKTSNFYQCTVSCATWEDMPYLVVERNANNAITNYIGFEGKLIEFIAKKLNFSLHLYAMNTEEIAATFNESGWIFEQLFKEKADFAVGAFHYKPESTESALFSQTTYYFVSNIYLVTNNILVESRYRIILSPFEADAWFLILIIFICSYSFMLMSRLYRCHSFIVGQHITTPYYNMFVILVGGTVGLLPPRNFARYILALWMLSSIVLRAAYQSGLYETLRDQPIDPPIQTIEEAARRNYIIEMAPESERYLKILPEVKDVSFLNTSEFEAFPSLAFSKVPTALLTPYEYFGYLRKMNQTISQNLHLIRERIFSVPLTFYVRKNSFLIRVFNDQISAAINYGYMERWKNEYMMQITEHELGIKSSATTVLEQSQNAVAIDAQTRVLSMQQLEAVFYIHASLLVLTFCVFLFENIWFRRKHLKRKP